MTKTVFISGSIKIKKLSKEHEVRINNIVNNGLNIVIGDASGVDLAVQKKLVSYDNVTLFHTSEIPRNNVGGWKTQHIVPTQPLKGALLHQEKDKAMVKNADYALVIWDGSSIGSLANIYRMALQRKASVVFCGESDVVIKDLDGALKLISSTPQNMRSELKKRLTKQEMFILSNYTQKDIFS
ncbi:hypothetical protein ACPEER_09050 [Pasteurella sp. PK-2025]|uniref:hypothetical protein n=1 Tax=Pasteurella sp. PK-2025 TaxID=3413133 RepID=UPI003C796404